MSRKSRELRLDAEEKWPALQRFFSCYLHQNRPDEHSRPEDAADAGIRDYPLEARQAVARDWWDWNSTLGAQYDPRPAIHEGLGVAVAFESPDEARKFMNSVDEKLVVSIRNETGKEWRP